MLIDKCPHCNTSYVQTDNLFSDQFIPGHPDNKRWNFTRCQNPKCKKLILAETNQEGEIEGIYPAGSFELDSNKITDAEIISDFREAGLCLSVGCFKASMVMSRRVLQRCLKFQGCTERMLVDAIDHAINNGIIRKALCGIATEIREYGNIGAHPDDDQLSNIDKDKAKHILDFARLLIEEFYEIPATAEQLRKDRQPPQPVNP